MSDKNALYHDIKAATALSKDLAPVEPAESASVSAVERGRRQHPNGVVEDYERIEFRR